MESPPASSHWPQGKCKALFEEAFIEEGVWYWGTEAFEKRIVPSDRSPSDPKEHVRVQGLFPQHQVCRNIGWRACRHCCLVGKSFALRNAAIGASCSLWWIPFVRQRKPRGSRTGPLYWLEVSKFESRLGRNSGVSLQWAWRTNGRDAILRWHFGRPLSGYTILVGSLAGRHDRASQVANQDLQSMQNHFKRVVWYRQSHWLHVSGPRQRLKSTMWRRQQVPEALHSHQRRRVSDGRRRRRGRKLGRRGRRRRRRRSGRVRGLETRSQRCDVANLQILWIEYSIPWVNGPNHGSTLEWRLEKICGIPFGHIQHVQVCGTNCQPAIRESVYSRKWRIVRKNPVRRSVDRSNQQRPLPRKIRHWHVRWGHEWSLRASCGKVEIRDRKQFSAFTMAIRQRIYRWSWGHAMGRHEPRLGSCNRQTERENEGSK